jgi:hypothetical protein
MSRSSRWDSACAQFDLVFHGPKADSKKRPTSVRRDGLDGRIGRPLTAELRPSMRKRLQSFRELDSLVFLNETEIKIRDEIETRKGTKITNLPLDLEEESFNMLKRYNISNIKDAGRERIISNAF